MSLITLTTYFFLTVLYNPIQTIQQSSVVNSKICKTKGLPVGNPMF